MEVILLLWHFFRANFFLNSTSLFGDLQIQGIVPAMGSALRDCLGIVPGVPGASDWCRGGWFLKSQCGLTALTNNKMP